MALALGRRTDLPIIKYVSVGFIEFWRGVPLITVLFMSSVMFPMFLPEDFMKSAPAPYQYQLSDILLGDDKRVFITLPRGHA